MPRGIPNAGFRIRNGKMIMVRGAVMPDTMTQTMSDANVEELISNQVDESEIKERIVERFDAMEIMAEETLRGYNKSLIISGPAGVGKSFGVMKKRKEAEAVGYNVTYVKGHIRATGLYRKLWENRSANNCIIFDDADAMFNDDVSLGLLKAACDSTPVRTINWLTETKMLEDDGGKMPREFDFEGSIIFITNYDFDLLISKGNRLAPHLQAMMSRSVYLDLMLKTPQDYLVRIKQVLFEGSMLTEQGLSEDTANELVTFMEQNVYKLRELSLRMVIKLSQLIKSSPFGWRKLAAVTCLKV